jgi:SAM-dependent methyltransferase
LSKSAQYDKIAQRYTAIINPLFPPRDGATYHTWLDECGDLTGRRVLDIGCGSGKSTLLLAQSGASVLGIDQSAEMISIANRESKPNGLDLKYLHADARHLEIQEDPFDLVTGAFLLHYAASTLELNAMMSGVVKYLAAKGQVVFLIHNPHDPVNEFNHHTKISRTWKDAPFTDGSTIEITMGNDNGDNVSFLHHFWSQQVYENAFTENGLNRIQWISPRFRQDLKSACPDWKYYEQDASKLSVLKARKGG